MASQVRQTECLLLVSSQQPYIIKPFETFPSLSRSNLRVRFLHLGGVDLRSKRHTLCM